MDVPPHPDPFYRTYGSHRPQHHYTRPAPFRSRSSVPPDSVPNLGIPPSGEFSHAARPRHYPPSSFQPHPMASSMHDRPPTPRPNVPNFDEGMRQNDLQSICDNMTRYLHQVVEFEMQRLHEHMSQVEGRIEHLRDEVDNIRYAQEQQDPRPGRRSRSYFGDTAQEEGPEVEEIFSEKGPGSVHGHDAGDHAQAGGWADGDPYASQTAPFYSDAAAQQDGPPQEEPRYRFRSVDGIMEEWNAEIRNGKTKTDDSDWCLNSEGPGQELKENVGDRAGTVTGWHTDNYVDDVTTRQDNIKQPDAQGEAFDFVTENQATIQQDQWNVQSSTAIQDGIRDDAPPNPPIFTGFNFLVDASVTEQVESTPAEAIEVPVPSLNVDNDKLKGDLTYSIGECAGMLKIFGRMVAAMSDLHNAQFNTTSQAVKQAVQDLETHLSDVRQPKQDGKL